MTNHMGFIQSANAIYSRLEDDISKEIFLARLQYETTSDARYLTGLSHTQRNIGPDVEQYYRQLTDYGYLRKVIVGAGFNGQCIADEICKGKIFSFIDNYRDNTSDPKTGLPVYAMSSYMKEYGPDHTQFIISVGDRSSSAVLFEQLKSYDVADKDIVVAPQDYRNNFSQYFDVFLPGEYETFVDCGCFDGSSAFRFAGWCGRQGYDKIWCLEPDKESYKKCVTVCSKLNACTVLPYGVGEKSGKVFFSSNGKEDARICKDGEAGSQSVDVVSLDELLKNERVTFIKMDIEGEELNALKGASEIISKQHPKLAISAYHCMGDFLNIPALLLEYNPEYRFYFRHYSMFINETVLYAK